MNEWRGKEDGLCRGGPVCPPISKTGIPGSMSGAGSENAGKKR